MKILCVAVRGIKTISFGGEKELGNVAGLEDLGRSTQAQQQQGREGYSLCDGQSDPILDSICSWKTLPSLLLVLSL